jgi:hypothetical protein
MITRGEFQERIRDVWQAGRLEAVGDLLWPVVEDLEEAIRAAELAGNWSIMTTLWQHHLKDLHPHDDISTAESGSDTPATGTRPHLGAR